MVVAYNNIRVSNVLDHPVNINIGKERRRLKDHTDAAKNSAFFRVREWYQLNIGKYS